LVQTRLQNTERIAEVSSIMSEQPASNPQAPSVQATSSRRTGVIVLSILGGVLAVCVCAIVLLVVVFRNAPDVRARDARIGTEVGEDGHIFKDIRTIPADAKEIHLEFYFENPANVIIPLEFRWYAGDQLIDSYSGVHEDGYVAAYIKLDPNQQGSLPAGNYHVEVWFTNTMILSEPFVVK
jgi:hypothetical protein